VASPRSLTISSFSNELIITHYSKFFKKNELEKFTALAANSFSEKKKGSNPRRN